MYIKIKDRKRLQTALESALSEVPGEEQQYVFRLILSFIYELNTKDGATSAGACGGAVLRDGFPALKTPDHFDAQYLEQLAALAKKIEHLSTTANNLVTLLHQELADGVFPAGSGGIVNQ